MEGGRRERSGGMVVGEKREGMGGSVSNDRCFIGEGLAVSHGHSSTAMIEISNSTWTNVDDLPYRDTF